MLMYGYVNNAEGNFNADNYVIENMIENDILEWYISITEKLVLIKLINAY